jgi:hypothetical protein
MRFVDIIKVIPILVFVFSAIAFMGFWNTDACLDHGGAISNYGFTCTGSRESFSPVWKRTNLVLWMFILTPPGVFAFAIHKMLSKFNRS